jgi:hypothetical protein
MTNPVLHRKHGGQTEATPRVGTRSFSKSDAIMADIKKQIAKPSSKQQAIVILIGK